MEINLTFDIHPGEPYGNRIKISDNDVIISHPFVSKIRSSLFYTFPYSILRHPGIIYPG